MTKADGMVAKPDNTGMKLPGRVIAFAAFLLVLMIIFDAQLRFLWERAWENDLNSYILLVPLIVAYLVYTERQRLPRQYDTSAGWAAVPCLIGLAFLVLLWLRPMHMQPLSENDHLSSMIFCFVCFVWAGGFLFLGKRWMATAAFPLAFLIFLVPLPDAVVEWFEKGLQLASAQAASLFFAISGLPSLRSGTVFELPGITLQVAPECSGIRSSWVLFITSLIAAYLLLRRPWSRLLLVSVVIPLGILRNGFRILVLGLLCVHMSPQILDSPLHRKGGPIFFVLALIPLALFLWILRRRETVVSAPAVGNVR